MRMRRWNLVLLLAGLLAFAGAPAASDPPKGGAPEAVKVVVRGKKALAEALEAAARPAWAGAAPRPVLLVFDVTPFTQKARATIEKALVALDAKAAGVDSWSVAALGSKPGKSTCSAAALAPGIDKLLGKQTDVVSTLTELTKTLKAWREKGGVVVYLADWHFEDDVGLEKFIKELQKKGRTLSVIGTEAAFRRGWNDGLRDVGERLEFDIRGTDVKSYWQGVGRDPFGGKDKRAPWHGGDTAYPYAPYRWDVSAWDTAFSQLDWDLADLSDELEDMKDDLDELNEPDGSKPEPEPGEPETDPETKTKIEALRAERAEVQKKLDEIFEKILDCDDAEEIKRLEAEEKALRKRDKKLCKQIVGLEEGRSDWDEDDEEEPEPPQEPDDEPFVPEELRGRLPGSQKDEPETPEWLDLENRMRNFPLPSSYGPYGLMRAAGATGGRYVLYSWNPSGRKTVVYEYSRCNLFPPDLRPRKEILADVKANVWASAVLEAWWVVLDSRTQIFEQYAPLRTNLRSPCPMDRVQGGEFAGMHFESPGDRTHYVRVTTLEAEAVAKALAVMEKALAKGVKPEGDVEQRFEAEALLFRHALRCTHFTLSESIRAAAEVPRRAWKEKKREPGIGFDSWLRRGRDPEKVRTYENVKPYDEEAGRAIIAERKVLLERFRGTPLGEELAMNGISTFKPDWWEKAERVPGTGRSPSESTDTPKPTPKPPGGGSGGGGPSTGGG